MKDRPCIRIKTCCFIKCGKNQFVVIAITYLVSNDASVIKIEDMGYSIKEICISLKLNRSSYYKWKKRRPSKSELLNVQITEYVKNFYEKSNEVLGYRKMCININREKIDKLPNRVNVKRIRRLMRILGLKSVIRKKRPDYVKSTPEITAENVLKRDFKATFRLKNGLLTLQNSSITLEAK